MNCPTYLSCSNYVNGALNAKEVQQFDAHLVTCSHCQKLVDSLAAENQSLRQALAVSVDANLPAENEFAAIPHFVAPLSMPQLLLWLSGLALASILINSAWAELLQVAALPSWLDWLVPTATGMALAGLNFTTNLITNGGELMDNMTQTVFAGVVIAATVSVLMQRMIKQAAPMCFALISAFVLVGQSADSQALDLRRADDRVTIPAGEVIDDTLIVMAETVVIEGDVTGDLFALGEKIVLRSKVSGNIFAFGEQVELEVEVGGSVFTAGEIVDLRKGSLAGNLYIAGEEVNVRQDVAITGNTFLASEDGDISASIGRDLLAAAEELTVLGKIDKSMIFYGEALKLAETAHIAGNLRVRIEDNAKLRIHEAATIVGEQDIDGIRGEDDEETEHDSSGNSIFGQLMKFLAAFVFGCVLFWLLPSLRSSSLVRGPELLTASAFGAIFLVAAPILAIVCMITLIGLPVGLAALLLWIIAGYAAGVVTAAFIGDALLSSGDQKPIVAFLLGLVVLYLLLMIPMVGSIVWFAALVMGLGLILRWARENWLDRAVA